MDQTFQNGGPVLHHPRGGSYGLIPLLMVAATTVACEHEATTEPDPDVSRSSVMSPCSPVVGDPDLRFRDVTHEVGVYDLNRAWGVSWRDVEWFIQATTTAGQLKPA